MFLCVPFSDTKTSAFLCVPFSDTKTSVFLCVPFSDTKTSVFLCVPFSDTKVVNLHGRGSEILIVEAVVNGYESSFFGSGLMSIVSIDIVMTLVIVVTVIN